MSVKIRLSRIGKKKAPFYRIVAIDSRKKRDGAFLEDLGTYDALNSKFVRFDLERVDHWINQGALPTDSVKKLIKLFKKFGLAAELKEEKIIKKVAPKKETAKEESKAEKKEAPEVTVDKEEASKA